MHGEIENMQDYICEIGLKSSRSLKTDYLFSLVKLLVISSSAVPESKMENIISIRFGLSPYLKILILMWAFCPTLIATLQISFNSKWTLYSDENARIDRSYLRYWNPSEGNS